MPTFDLRGIRVGKYNNTSGAISYSDHVSVGDAMACNLELKFAEGRLYAEGKLAEYLKQAIGGSLSVGTKYIPDAAQSLMYGATEKTRTVNTKQIAGLQFSSKDAANYVGVAFYAPDRIDGVQKYTCVFVSKALFGPPAMAFKTKGENIEFQTPTTTGEFLPDDSTGELLIETAVADSMEDAVAWCKLVLGEG